jgi:hypothetical protein
MISTREFCREPGYPISIFLTYSFDPLFFERIPRDDLRLGGTRRIIIVADGGEATDAVRRAMGQIFYLGREYLLAETKAANTFHPKMIVRLSPTGGRVWIGSGNLNFTGWGANQEMATAWSVGPGMEDSGAWLGDMLDAVGTMTRSAAFSAQLEAVRTSVKWLDNSPAQPAMSPVLLGMPTRPLAPQLVERWKGRTFNVLKVYTGSTDVEGAFLLWAHKTFGIKKVVICLSPAFASFDAAKLSKLPFEVKFVRADPKRLMHAKFYWFASAGENAAVMGSANCSAAAWLANHDAGNVELVVPYDTADAAEFSRVLELFDGEHLLPAEILNAPILKPNETNSGGEGTTQYRIVSLRVRPSGRTIEATLEPAPPDDYSVELVIGENADEMRIAMKARGNVFVGGLPFGRSVGLGTVFATIEVISGKMRSVTPPRWIDNEPAISIAAREREVDPGLESLAGRNFKNSSHQKIMAAISSVSADLLRFDEPDLSSFAADTSGTRPRSKEAEERDEPIRMLDPASVLFSLKDLAAQKAGGGHNTFGFYGVSLQGVMGLLFSIDKEPEIDLSQETWDGEAIGEGNDPTADNGSKPGEKGKPPPPPNRPTSSETLADFRREIDHFLIKLGQQKFADECPAGRLMQAVAFPIMLCTKGSEAGWLPEGMLASVTCRVVDTMLRKSYGSAKPRGLFRQVQIRYDAAGKHDEFLRTVGEGALWAALLASLAQMEGSSLSSLVRQAASIASVFACTELLATSSPDQLALFIRTLIIRDAAYAVTQRAGKLADAIGQLNHVLKQNWDRLYDSQGGDRALHSGGSIMWCRKWGWEVLPRTAAQSYYADHINLEVAAKANSDVQLAIDVLWEAMRTSAAPAESMEAA